MNYEPNRQSPLGQVLIISDGEVTTDDLTQEDTKETQRKDTEEWELERARDQGLV